MSMHVKSGRVSQQMSEDPSGINLTVDSGEAEIRAKARDRQAQFKECCSPDPNGHFCKEPDQVSEETLVDIP
jgi:hypothetical protein